jgi:NitT/TauT family transport system ATP-binding protein
MWFYAQMVRWRQIEPASSHVSAVRSTYRPDIYRRALAPLRLDLPAHDMKPEHFFDGTDFEPGAE